jgi:hypothetical protein
MLEVKRSLKLFFVGALCYTDLTGASCEAQYVTGLTGHHHLSDRWTLAAQSFWEEKLKLVITPIHPPLGEIKVLSIGIKAWCSDSSLTA